LSENANHILKTYLRRLTNLSGNNRSLLLLRLRSEQLIDLQQLSFLNGEKAFEIIKDLIAGKSKKICPVLDSRMETINEASRKLKRLQRIDKLIFEERGSNDLHMGWPMVHGKFSDGTLVRCPLLYFPVSITLENNQWVLHLREDSGITFNKSFLLAYSFYNRVKLNDKLNDTSFEDFDADATVFRTQLYQLLRDSVEINFNPDTFTDELIPFQEYKKDEFEKQHHSGEIKLFQEAVLGIFPQAGSQLVPDYLYLIEHQASHDLEDFFSSRTQGDAVEISQWVSSVKEEKIYAPFPLDAYQEHALRIVKDGRSVIVQGPPGTGKSQLISNLMADAIASGKKVLLVCQKRVALDVVYDRLAKIELSDFLGLIHDFRNDRRTIYEKIARQIDRIEDYKIRNRSIDAIQIERRFFQVCRSIDQRMEELEEFRKALFSEQDCGISVKELYLTSNPKAPNINIRQEYQYFNFSTLRDVVNKFKRYAKYAGSLEIEEHPWRNRKSFVTLQLSHLSDIEKLVKDIPKFQQHIRTALNKIIAIDINLVECETLLHRQRDAEEMLGLLNDDIVFQYFQMMSNEKEEETSLLWLQNMERVCLNCFEGPGVETTLQKNQIDQCQTALQQRMETRRNLFRLIRWELFSENKFFLKRVLIGNGLEYNLQGLTTLEQRIDNRLNLEHHLTALRQKSWLHDLPKGINQALLKGWFATQAKAIQSKLIFHSLRELRDVTHIQKYTRLEFLEMMRSVFTTISTIPFHRSDWQEYLTPYQILQLIQQPERESDFIGSLQADFDKLCEFDRVKESLLSYETEVIIKLREVAGGWDPKELLVLFQNSVRLAWIEHIEMKYPILRSVSTFKMEEVQTELQQMVEEKQKLSIEILLLRARERVYEQIEYNRLNNRVTYRDLHHQVTKKKKIWPVRKLMAEFSEELFNLIPCWMASPESVSAIFPMKELFDVVIFDEASQCFSERGIPAMYRGKQVLIAGDEKQLRPFELYQVRWEEEVEGPDFEVDSLLELSNRYLPTVHLQGHYRSQALPLIDFSNRFFYEGRLKLLPEKNVINSQQPSIEFHKVTGVWEDQTNRLEGESVVQLAVQQFKMNPDKEIGIITFNAPQQMLIMDLLEERCGHEGMVIPESLFIKNIENVQGDEKDIIIFSIGYAPDKDGKMNMQFGSLNVAGGENRLNVAITRAREKIIILSSILPEDLKLQGIKNEGPKLLRKYLEYAREVSAGEFKIKDSNTPENATSWYLKDRIAVEGIRDKTNFTLSTQALPFSDLVVKDRLYYAGIILSDDELYHSALTSKEPHVYVPALLQHKNWEYLRIFSRNWWSDRENVENELAKFMYRLSENKLK